MSIHIFKTCILQSLFCSTMSTNSIASFNSCQKLKFNTKPDSHSNPDKVLAIDLHIIICPQTLVIQSPSFSKIFLRSSELNNFNSTRYIKCTFFQLSDVLLAQKNSKVSIFKLTPKHKTQKSFHGPNKTISEVGHSSLLNEVAFCNYVIDFHCLKSQLHISDTSDI